MELCWLLVIEGPQILFLCSEGVLDDSNTCYTVFSTRRWVTLFHQPLNLRSTVCSSSKSIATVRFALTRGSRQSFLRVLVSLPKEPSLMRIEQIQPSNETQWHARPLKLPHIFQTLGSR